MRYAQLGSRAQLAIQYDLLALEALRAVSSGFLPWSDSALRPAAIQIGVNDIYLNRRRWAVEFGSGISSVYLATMLANGGGQLLSFDHNRNWIEEVRSWLTGSSRDAVTFVHAPLVDAHFGGSAISWYDPDVVRGALGGFGPIDFALIDGPPAHESPECLNRGPAIPTIRASLATDATILIDDIDRDGEQRIADQWSEILGTRHRTLLVEAGVAMWRLGATRNTSQ